MGKNLEKHQNRLRKMNNKLIKILAFGFIFCTITNINSQTLTKVDINGTKKEIKKTKKILSTYDLFLL